MSYEIWIVLLTCTVLIVCPIVVIQLFRDRKEKKRITLKSELVINITSRKSITDEQTSAEVTTGKSSNIESLDSIYARNVGKLVCPYCETINLDAADQCCACGNRLKK